MIRRFPASCDSHVIVVRYRHIFRVKYTAWSLKKVVARSVAVSWIIRGKSVLSSWNW
ncbi:putative transposase [Escherichia coli 2-177-06_S3_C3]|nr:putative transposase [Escherichia coli 2-177-06_S3_C3]